MTTEALRQLRELSGDSRMGRTTQLEPSNRPQSRFSPGQLVRVLFLWFLICLGGCYQMRGLVVYNTGSRPVVLAYAGGTRFCSVAPGVAADTGSGIDPGGEKDAFLVLSEDGKELRRISLSQEDVGRRYVGGVVFIHVDSDDPVVSTDLQRVKGDDR